MDINDLYKKIEDFEKSLSKDFHSNMECRKGCSQCCYVDLSVFKVEADNIERWLKELSEDSKDELLSKLKLVQESRLNFHGHEAEPCVFLKNDECLIYPVRPLICRTQGNAFQFKQDQTSYLDICPLNEKALDHMQQTDVMNLDLINTILVQLNQQSDNDVERVSLKEIRSKHLP